jgi:peptide/nickel transport system permease protein
MLRRAYMVQDMYLAGSMMLIISMMTIVGTLLSDILLAFMDPRIKYGGIAE